jgi:hypothetical protein
MEESLAPGQRRLPPAPRAVPAGRPAGTHAVTFIGSSSTPVVVRPAARGLVAPAKPPKVVRKGLQLRVPAHPAVVRGAGKHAKVARTHTSQ